MPSTGGTSFLRTRLLYRHEEKQVSMPSTGGTSFLQDILRAGWIHLTSCQCPLRAGPHFYGSKGRWSGQGWQVSMPSTGGTSFLQNMIIFWTIVEVVCQCPLRAGPHFYYTNHQGTVWELYWCVNALYGRDLISTYGNVQSRNYQRWCQCPLRAGPHFYSTFLRPNVYKGFRSIFSAHFSEYSDISQKQWAKVGKARIVFIRIQFGIFLMFIL